MLCDNAISCEISINFVSEATGLDRSDVMVALIMLSSNQSGRTVSLEFWMGDRMLDKADVAKAWASGSKSLFVEGEEIDDWALKTRMVFKVGRAIAHTVKVPTS